MVEPMSEDKGFAELPEFSLFSGGLLFQLFRKTRLSGDHLESISRRILVVLCRVCLPFLVLSAFAGASLGILRVPGGRSPRWPSCLSCP
jgi:hypothetical protein